MNEYNVPKGWALVPMEATPEMEQAAEKYWNERRFKSFSADPRTWQGVYAAMLAAAHAAPEADLSSHPLVAALCDLSYRAGLKAGWNYCADGDETGFARSMESAREAVAVLNERRQRGAPTAPEQVEHERKLFEARMRRVAPGVNLEMIGDRYNELDTQWKFELWLDRAALAGKGATK